MRLRPRVQRPGCRTWFRRVPTALCGGQCSRRCDQAGRSRRATGTRPPRHAAVDARAPDGRTVEPRPSGRDLLHRSLPHSCTSQGRAARARPRDAPLQLSLPRVGPPLSFQSPPDSLPEARSSDQPGSETVASDEHPWSGAAPATPSRSLCHRKATRVALSVRKPVLATRPGCGR